MTDTQNTEGGRESNIELIMELNEAFEYLKSLDEGDEGDGNFAFAMTAHRAMKEITRLTAEVERLKKTVPTDHVIAYVLCGQCSSEQRVPLTMAGNVSPDWICNHFDCRDCEARIDCWIKISPKP